MRLDSRWRERAGLGDFSSAYLIGRGENSARFSLVEMRRTSWCERKLREAGGGGEKGGGKRKEAKPPDPLDAHFKLICNGAQSKLAGVRTSGLHKLLQAAGVQK